jgi:hypothetical protein
MQNRKKKLRSIESRREINIRESRLTNLNWKRKAKHLIKTFSWTEKLNGKKRKMCEEQKQIIWQNLMTKSRHL